MSSPISGFLATVPDRIIAFLDANPHKRGLLSLYFDRNAHILDILKGIPEIAARPITRVRQFESVPLAAERAQSGSVAIDESVKLFPRIVGEFSLEELRTLLRTGVFLDIKVFGEQDIKIESR